MALASFAPITTSVAAGQDSTGTIPTTAAPPAATSTAASPTITPEAVELDRLVVRPQYESQLRAIDFKRASDAIQDTVSSDSMGQYPDKNVGESLSRLPGVSVTRDQGEGRFVVIRGLDAALNSVTVDGVAIGTPEADSRAAPLDTLPSDSTERLTVVKSPTPDMPGDSVGGAIQVESASGFDRDGRNMRAKAELSHQDLSGQTSPKASFNYSDVFAGNTIAVALGMSYQDRNYESDNIETEYDTDFSDTPLALETQQRKYAINRKRTGVNLNLDWRPDRDNRYYLRSLFTDFTDAETRQTSVISFSRNEEANAQGEDEIVNVTDLGGGRYRFDDVDPGDFGRRVRWRTKQEDTSTVSAGGENRFGAAVLDYKLGYTKMRERVEDEVEARFEYQSDENVAIELDQGRGIPRYRINDDPLGGWLRNENYTLNRFVVSPIWVDDDETSAQVNFRFDGAGMTWKTGLLGRWRDRDVNIDETELREGPDLSPVDWTLSSPKYTHGNMGDGISSWHMREFLRNRLGDYSARAQDIAANTEISLIEDYVSNEDILAGYLMATRDFGNLRMIAGVRVERTEFGATGNVVDLEDEETIGRITKREVSRSYTNVLPGLHLRYDTDNDWVFRGAFTQTVGRPTFGDISPRTKINRGDLEVELGNPQLDPYESRNLDLSIERYIGESGLLSIGLFQKRIDGYITDTLTRDSADYPNMIVTQPRNGDNAEVLGLELNWQQHFANGLLFGLSGTWLDSEFSLPDDQTSTDDPLNQRGGEKLPLPLSSERLYSAHFGFEKGPLSTRLAAVYRDDYLDSIGDASTHDIWVAANTQLDFTLDYKVNDLWGFYLEAANLLDEPLELYQGTPAYTLQNELYGRTYVAGVKLRF